MNSNETYYTDLITRYLSGEATMGEMDALSDWIDAAPEHARTFHELHRTWVELMAGQADRNLDLQKEWEALIPRLSGYKPETSREPEVIPFRRERLPWQVTLIRASLIAAIALVLILPGWMAYRYFTLPETMRITAAEEVLETTLPDGSRITLNAYSSLSYTEEFGQTGRNVELQGEGYFEVYTDSLRPFIVHCGNTLIEVSGTSFYADASGEERTVEVILLEGSVSVYFEDARSTGKRIIPGEKARLTETDRRIVITQNEDPNFLSWKSMHLVFIDDPLDIVIRTVNKVYHSEIVLGGRDLSSCRLTASFDRQPLESVLNVIMATLDLRSETTPSEIILYGKGCN